MSQDMATATTPPLMVACSVAASITTTVMLAPTLVPTTASDQQDVVLLSPLLPRNTREVADLATEPKQIPQSQMPFQTYANYAMDPLPLEFSFKVGPPTDWSIYAGVCYGACFLLSGSNVDVIFTYEVQPMGFVPLHPPREYLWQVYVHLEDGPRNTVNGCSLHCF